jgi:hypothetical protein
MKGFLILLGTLRLSSAHGIIKWVEIDGVKYATPQNSRRINQANHDQSYPGFDPRIDPKYNAKRIMWGFNVAQSQMGMGPVLDVKSQDMTCRKDPTPPALNAVARAGANMTFQWTPYFPSHKGPVMTVSTLVSELHCEMTDIATVHGSLG